VSTAGTGGATTTGTGGTTTVGTGGAGATGGSGNGQGQSSSGCSCTLDASSGDAPPGSALAIVVAFSSLILGWRRRGACSLSRTN
jgi:hypothetical protein